MNKQEFEFARAEAQVHRARIGAQPADPRKLALLVMNNRHKKGELTKDQELVRSFLIRKS